MTRRLTILVVSVVVFAVGCSQTYYIEVENPCSHPLDVLVTPRTDAHTPELRNQMISEEFRVSGRVVPQPGDYYGKSYTVYHEEIRTTDPYPLNTLWIDSADYSIDANPGGPNHLIKLPISVCEL